ncbi:ribonuclease HII [Anaerobacillus alkalilacustris]|uniref:Ribonuclease HII n=1 Tax=Anaerobacillus alkalilacustris TaxID=393763 RepID=A0A1S2LM45_9BACI|nr:ribonuclease HII [Anaerobacillus alkalilacustris]OIJ13183.1 ribonuclease HII [Anaerobacillus alkalilacustris]
MRKTIKELEDLLRSNMNIDNDTLKAIINDERKGVQKAYSKWIATKEKNQQLLCQFNEMSKYEIELRNNGHTFIAGIDEVGRGPLAGPVVAAAVILPENFILLGLTDSKKISKKNREDYFQVIQKEALAVGLGIVSADKIDQLNIYEATKLAMQKAISELKIAPDHLLIDAMKLPVSIKQTSIIKGDSKSISIAASSIIAKVTRDRYMEQLAEKFPQYGFENHMGYGTKEHLAAIDQHGVCHEHRKSFAPVRERCLSNTLF